MKYSFFIISIIAMTSCFNKGENTAQSPLIENKNDFANSTDSQEREIKVDSIKIANSSLGFYKWYLECLKDNSTYNKVQIIYHWEDSIPVLEISDYLSGLKEIGFVSDSFFNSEVNRFKVCQDSLNTIDKSVVDSCGCSVGEFYRECDFIDYYYWINSNEKYNGCEVKSIEISENKAICQLRFYYNSENSIGKQFDDSFICKIHLSKYSDKWLIDEIIRYFD